jgi:hypothetical protein
MMEEHTPGPWRHGAKNVYAGKDVIAQCWDFTLYDPIPHPLPAQANARFIAAAPALLAACEAIIAAEDGTAIDFFAAVGKAKTAIAAARPATEPVEVDNAKTQGQ